MHEAEPYLISALFCADITFEPDTAPTLHGLIQNIRHRPLVDDPDAVMPPFAERRLKFFLAIGVKRALGQLAVRLTWELPDGTTLRGPEGGVTFREDGVPQQQMAILNLQMKFEQPGVYQLVVRVEDLELVKVPLRVVYDPI